MPIQKNAKAVMKMPILIQVKKHVWTAQSIDLYGMEINVSLVQLDPIIIQHQENANYVHQDLLIMKSKEDVPVLSKHHFCIKTVLVLTASRHIFGTVKLNLVMHVHWLTFTMYHWTNVHVQFTLHMKEIKSVWLVTNHFSGTIKQNNVNNVQQLSFMIHKLINVSAHYSHHINITEGA